MRTPHLIRLASALAGGAALVELAHLAPAVSWLPAVRGRAFPALAGRGRAGHVALTFDDGPEKRSTPLFLDELDRLDVRATFFLLGAKLEANPALGRELVARGHEVALHGYQHNRALLPRPGTDLRDLRRAVIAFEAACDRKPHWYRPPYGVLTIGRLHAARVLGMRPVLWTAWAKDWSATASVESVLATLEPDLTGGATVLLHDADPTGDSDAWRVTLDALPGLVRRCRALGLTLGPLGEHGVPEPSTPG